MTRWLAELIEAPQPLFTVGLRQLEALSGQPAVDIQLTLEIQRRWQQTLDSLELSPDASQQQIQQALITCLGRHNQELSSRLDLGQDLAFTDLTKRLLGAVKTHKLLGEGWFIKPSVAKRLLRQHPPVITLEIHQHKQVAELYKHVPWEEVWVAAQALESQNWQRKFAQQYRQLDGSDFEVRAQQLLVLDDLYQAKLTEWSQRQRTNQLLAPVVGVGAWFAPESIDPSRLALQMLVDLCRGLNHLRAVSTYLKIHTTHTNFSQLVWRAGTGRPLIAGKLFKQEVTWEQVQAYLGSQKLVEPAEGFGLHLQAADLTWHRSSVVFSQLAQSFSFWKRLDYVGHPSQTAIISFNLEDVVAYYQEPASRSLGCRALQVAAHTELWGRYFQQPRVLEQILGPLGVDQQALGL